MTISKLTNNIQSMDEVDKINEIIDEFDNLNVDVDGSTITKNSSDELQTVAIKDNRSGNALKLWTGTVVQEEAVTVKDSNTLYYTPETTNVSDIVTDLNNKCDVDGSNATFPHIVETYVNGTSWYNVYSNGWCEQGGVVPTGADVDYTGSLLKAYKDTNYQIGFTTLQYNTSAYTTQWQYLAIYQKTNATFGCKAISFTRGWEAKGYIR